MRQRLLEAKVEKRTLSVNVAASDHARLMCLLRLGYEVKESSTVVSIRELALPFPAPALPLGFSIRSVAGEHEAGLLAEVHSNAFGSSWTSAE